MTSNNPKKRYFKPKKPVNKMTDEERDEFAQFIFKSMMCDITYHRRNNNESR